MRRIDKKVVPPTRKKTMAKKPWYFSMDTKNKIMLLALIQILAFGGAAWVEKSFDLASTLSSIDLKTTVKTGLWLLSLIVALAASFLLVSLGFRILPKPGESSPGKGIQDQRPQEQGKQGGAQAQQSQDVPPESTEADHPNEHLYDQFLSFLGVTMAILVLDVAVIIGGLIKQGYLQVPLNLPPTTSDRVEMARGLVLIISCGLGVLGSVFFTANTLHRKRGQVEFDVEKFWSGFWFRLGESVLFALVLFLAIIAFQENPDKYLAYLIPTALLIGMFVKTGERLIFGLAERIFAMMRGILPVSEGAATSRPGRPRNLTVTKKNGQVILQWDEPISKEPVDSYRIYKGGQDAPLGETHATVRRAEVEALADERIKVTAVNRSGEGEAISAQVPGS
ncbi:MAG: fibronectin type III domain-containing protein [Acidobacteriota bacterium]